MPTASSVSCRRGSRSGAIGVTRDGRVGVEVVPNAPIAMWLRGRSGLARGP